MSQPKVVTLHIDRSTIMKDKLQQWWIRHLYKKVCKAMARFDNAIGKDTKNLFMKELLNRVYGTRYMKVFYDDTDSIADGMKYTE